MVWYRDPVAAYRLAMALCLNVVERIERQREREGERDREKEREKEREKKKNYGRLVSS